MSVTLHFMLYVESRVPALEFCPGRQIGLYMRD